MNPWMVTQGDNQFAVEGLAELIDMAKRGDLGAGDMVQPPGAADWVYASEVPALAEHVRGADDDDDLDRPRGGLGKLLPTLLIGGLIAVIAVGGLGVIALAQYLPAGDEVLVGEGGLSYSQMIVTDHGVALVDAPTGGRQVATVAKDEVLELLAKRGDHYRARTRHGVDGWLPVNQVLPMYQLGNERVQERYDPLYNPDRYVEVQNASWIQLPDARPGAATVTVFHFQFRNASLYDMTDLKILVTIKNAKGGVLEQREIAIDGVIPKKGSTMVGTIKPDPKAADEAPRLLTEASYDAVKATDADLQDRWGLGIEVTMEVEDFDTANVDILELRAIPDAG